MGTCKNSPGPGPPLPLPSAASGLSLSWTGPRQSSTTSHYTILSPHTCYVKSGDQLIGNTSTTTGDKRWCFRTSRYRISSSRLLNCNFGRLFIFCEVFSIRTSDFFLVTCAMAEGDSNPFAALDTHDGHGLIRAPPLAAEHLSRADPLALPSPEHEVNCQQEDEQLLPEREMARNR